MKHFRLGIPALLLLACGCGTGAPATGQLTGKVLLGDQVARSGTITFVDAYGQETATAVSPEGKYRVSSVALGPAQVTFVNHSLTPFTKEPGGPTYTTAYEVRREEREHDFVFQP